jgi:hypothetical protein
MLQYFFGVNNDAGKSWVVNAFNENVTVAAALEVQIHDHLIELSADEELDTFGLP